MIHKARRRLGPALLAACLSTPAAAIAAQAEVNGPAATQNARLTPQDQETITQLERYLSGIGTLRARFRQTSSNGARASGDVWLDRPGKLRFEYDSPHPGLLVSNGHFVVYLDRELEQASYLPVSETPLWFLLKERIDMAATEDYRVAGVARDQGQVRLHVVQAGSEIGEPGSVTLTFQESPLQLTSWRIVDQQGITTEVMLRDPRFGVQVDSDKFDFGKLDLPDRQRNRRR